MGTRGSRDQGDGREEAESPLRRWFSSLSRGVKWLVGAVVAAGAVAGAIGSIVALWPDPPAQLRAELSDVKIDRQVTLDEYELRHGTETAWAPSAATLLLAADVVAQAEPEEGTATDETATDETATDGTATDETATDVTATDGTATDEDGGPEEDEDIVREPQPSAEERARLGEGLDLALREQAVPELDLGDVCRDELSDPDCGLRSTLSYLLSAHSEVSAVIVAERLAELFEGMRTSEEGEPQPVGVDVNFNVSLTGFHGRRADVRWSLYAK